MSRCGDGSIVRIVDDEPPVIKLLGTGPLEQDTRSTAWMWHSLNAGNV